jgi:hypothetical protein
VYRVTRVNRIGQITGSPRPRPWYLRDPLGYPLLTDTGRWNAIGIDEGTNTFHPPDGRLYFFIGDVATDQSGTPPDNSDLTAWTTEPEPVRHGGHLLTESWDFQLPNSGPNVRGEPGWQFCMRCCALFYTLGAPGACSLGGIHDTFGLSWDLSVPYEPSSEGQSGWRFCVKCHQLFWTGGAIDGCTGGGNHDENGSWAFVLPVNPGSQGGQSDWRYCANCHCLFYNGYPTKGVCAAAPGGGIHLNAVTHTGYPNGPYEPFAGPEPTGWLGSNENPGAAFSFDGRMYVVAGVADPSVSRRKRDGDPQPGNYVFSKAEPGAAGVWDIEFLLAPKLGWCADDRGLQPHAPLGLKFLAVRNIGEQPNRQNGFRMCRNCEALVFAGAGNGLCFYDSRGHDADEGWGDFSLELGVNEDAHNQSHWRQCRRCAAVYWADDPADAGRCPAGGQHQSTGEVFRMPHDIPLDDHLYPGVRFCVRCHGLVRTDQTNVMVWTSTTVVDNARHPALQHGSGQGLVMIAYDWQHFSLAWMPLFSGQRPRFDSIRYFHKGKRRWTDVPDRSQGYELFSHPYGTYTHVSASWQPDPGCWVVVYGTASSDRNQTSPIVARFGTDLVTWSDEQPIFDPLQERAYGQWMHIPQPIAPSADHINEIPPPQPNSQMGWAYGAFIIDHYTRYDPSSRTLNLVYTLSPGSPYQIQLVETSIVLPDPLP